MLLKDNRTQWISVAVASLILFICFVGFYQLQQHRNESRQELLEEKIRITDQLFTRWFHQQKQTLNTWSRYPQVLQSAQLLSILPSDRRELIAAPSQSELRQFFSPLIKSSNIDSYMLIDSRGMVRAASDNRLVGEPSPIAEYPALFAPLWQGSNQWLLPYISPYPVPDHNGVFRQDQPLLLIAAPVSNGLEVQSALIFTVNMRRELHHLLNEVVVTPDLFIQVSAKNRVLVDIGQRLAFDASGKFEEQIATQENRQLPVSYTLGKVFPVSRAFSNQQYLLLGIGSLSMLALVSLLVFLFREKTPEAKPDPLSKLLYDRGREGLIQVSEQGEVVSFNPQAGMLLSGSQDVTPQAMSILLTECALGLNDESGKLLGDLKSLITGGSDQTYYAWWSATGIKRLLAFTREHFSAGQESILSLKDVTRTRQEFLRLKRQSEALNEAAELVLWIDRDGGIVGANATASVQLGYSYKELQGLVIGDVDSTINEESWKLIWSRIRRGEGIEQEGNVLRRNGISFPAEVLIRYYADGFDEYACFFLRDISKRKRLEADLYRKRMRLTEKLSVTSQELEVREAENEALIEALPDLLVVFNSRFEVLSFQQPKGDALSLELAQGEILFDIFPQLPAEVIQQKLTDQVYSGLARYFTEITLDNQGSPQILELRFARTGTNKVLLLIRDITERKREEYFRQFNNRLLMSISQMQTQFICSPDKRPDIAEQLRSLVDLAQSESGFYWLAEPLQQKLGCRGFDHYHRIEHGQVVRETDTDRIQERIVQVIAHWRASIEPPKPMLLPLTDIFTGRDIPNHGLLLLPVVYSDHPVICFSLVLQDYRHWASESRLFEPWLSTIAALLAAHESENERLWAEENLKLEKERAEYASQAKTQFLSRMSHEFRTPLNAILGFGHLLQMEEAMDEEHKEHLAQIVNSGEAMLALVDDVLDLAQLERREFSVDMGRVSLTSVVTDCVSEMIAQIEQADLRFEADLPNKDYFVQADEKRLRQVIHSLLKNAISYTDSGGLITVRHHCFQRFCELSIQDTGKGISQDFLDKLFMPFEVAEGYIEAEGMGNGLAIARYAVEAMGGSIHVDSEVGVGSIFTLKIPCDQTEEDTGCCAEVQESNPLIDTLAESPCSDSTSVVLPSGELPGNESIKERKPQPVSAKVIDHVSDESNLASPPTDNKPFRVLYVEDDEANRKVLERLVYHLDADINFLAVGSAEDGIAEFLDSTPDLMFVDMNLGLVSGSEVLGIIRDQPQGKELPVIAVSGDVATEAIDRALDEGFDDYLCKPVSIESLTSVITRYRS
ncbi:ATP-binding protein [Oceanospirillum sanctuarii]|uniref:ATP-binding protein n=1 Tax=Oceanospirillum sanctuarii TaxID=1434821 RepID=UPI000A3B33AA|nr:ATP-binding protein [Oceanospirillum sanctuarii]